MARLTTAIVLVMAAAACGKPAPVETADPYLTEIAKFREAREAVLKTDTGWLTIAGLFFLTKPETTFGSDQANDIVLPAGAPGRAGTFSMARRSGSATANLASAPAKDHGRVRSIVVVCMFASASRISAAP